MYSIICCGNYIMHGLFVYLCVFELCTYIKCFCMLLFYSQMHTHTLAHTQANTDKNHRETRTYATYSYRLTSYQTTYELYALLRIHPFDI